MCSTWSTIALWSETGGFTSTMGTCYSKAWIRHPIRRRLENANADALSRKYQDAQPISATLHAPVLTCEQLTDPLISAIHSALSQESDKDQFQAKLAQSHDFVALHNAQAGNQQKQHFDHVTQSKTSHWYSSALR